VTTTYNGGGSAKDMLMAVPSPGAIALVRAPLPGSFRVVAAEAVVTAAAIASTHTIGISAPHFGGAVFRRSNARYRRIFKTFAAHFDRCALLCARSVHMTAAAKAAPRVR
jgi:hypothetical protein